MVYHTQKHQLVLGRIETITGSMFSGKTEELILRLRKAQIARKRIQTFKPTTDARYSDRHIVSHNNTKIEADVVARAEEILKMLHKNTEVIGIDEGQFFNEDLIAICTEMANKGKRIIVSGLDTDFSGKPFGPMPQLLAVSDQITKRLAKCKRCGNPATRTQRLVTSKALFVIGGSDKYEARCRLCFKPST